MPPPIPPRRRGRLAGRLALAGILALATAGCAAPGRADYAAQQPAGPAVAPRFTDRAFIAEDGARLPLHAWLPAGPVKAVILALHGFNDYSQAFAGPGALLAARGIATYAYDQRGFGAAPLRGRWPGRWRLAEDLGEASRVLRRRYPGVPLYLLGESMGGAVVIVAEAGLAGIERPAADGIILVAPAVWGRATMNAAERVALWAGIRLAPSLALTGRGIIHVQPSDNIAMLRALGRDPLVIKATRIDAIYGLVDLMDAALAAAPRLDMPLLYLYGGRDEIVPRTPTELMIARLPAAARSRQRVAWYANGYHMLLRDLDAAVVVGDIAGWVAAKSAPLPSAADRYAAALLGPKLMAQAPAPSRLR